MLNLPRKESGVLVILTIITIASILTALGIFDTLVTKVKAALIIPITGFAHSMTSAALEYKNEGISTWNRSQYSFKLCRYRNIIWSSLCIYIWLN